MDDFKLFWLGVIIFAALAHLDSKIEELKPVIISDSTYCDTTIHALK